MKPEPTFRERARRAIRVRAAGAAMQSQALVRDALKPFVTEGMDEGDVTQIVHEETVKVLREIDPFGHKQKEPS